MNKHKAEILRTCIIKQYTKSKLIGGNFTMIMKEKFGVNSVDEWALSISEIMELKLHSPELYFMAQIAKIARLIGCTEQDAKLLAVRAFADNSNLIENSEYLENELIECLKLYKNDFYQSTIDYFINSKQK